MSDDRPDISCAELVELVTDYLEDRMAEDARTRLELHLAYCPPCRVYVEQVRTTVAVVGKLTEESVPASTRDELLAAFRGWKGGTGGHR
ncbi:MAG: zf-HC2 domain-containing protein [Anaeromyxobacter sp.]